MVRSPLTSTGTAAASHKVVIKEMANGQARVLQVILDDDFNIIGTAQGGKVTVGDGEELTVGAVAAPGQRVVEIEVPEEVAAAEQAVELHAQLRSHLG